MFKRRSPQTLSARLRRLLLPSMGWRRTLRYFRHRLIRLPGTPRSIAAGFAFGAAVAFLPFVGFHLIIGAVIAALFRVSVLGSALGALLVGNPWTYPVILVATYRLGCILLGWTPRLYGFHHLSFEHLIAHAWNVLAPMTLGGLLIGVAAWLIVYFPVRRLISLHHLQRHHRLQRSVHPAKELPSKEMKA